MVFLEQNYLLQPGTIDVISNTKASDNTSNTATTYSTGQVDFVKLDGNLKVDGVSKFTDNLFSVLKRTNSPAEPKSLSYRHRPR